MTLELDALTAALDHRGPPATEDAIRAFEARLGVRLPETYRRFLATCNGGWCGGALTFRAEDGKAYPLQHVGGLREEPHFSLLAAADTYQVRFLRIPRALLWIADDPFGNAYCLGVTGPTRDRVYFWDHEREPEEWDGTVETAGNLRVLADSFEAFVGGIVPNPA